MPLHVKLANPFNASHRAFGAMVQSNEVYLPRWMARALTGFVARLINADR